MSTNATMTTINVIAASDVGMIEPSIISCESADTDGRGITGGERKTIARVLFRTDEMVGTVCSGKHLNFHHKSPITQDIQ